MTLLSLYFRFCISFCPLIYIYIYISDKVLLCVDAFFCLHIFCYQVMGEGEEQGVVKIADFGLARIYQAPLKPLSENGVLISCFPFT